MLPLRCANGKKSLLNDSMLYVRSLQMNAVEKGVQLNTTAFDIAANEQDGRYICDLPRSLFVDGSNIKMGDRLVFGVAGVNKQFNARLVGAVADKHVMLIVDDESLDLSRFLIGLDSGFVNNETNAVLSGSLGYGGSSQGAVNLGNYEITAFGLTSNNYFVSYVPGTLSITNVQPPIPPLPPLNNPPKSNASEKITEGSCTDGPVNLGDTATAFAAGSIFTSNENITCELDAADMLPGKDKSDSENYANCADSERLLQDIKIRVLDGGVRLAESRLMHDRGLDDINSSKKKSQ